MIQFGNLSARYAQIRIFQFLIAEFALIAGLFLIFKAFPGEIFWPLSVGLIIPALFSEPYFVGPRMAFANAVAQIGSYFSSDHSTEIALWNLLVASSIIVGLSAILAIFNQEKSGQPFHWVSTRFGRAVVLGSVVVIILLLQVAATNSSNATGMAVLMLFIYALVFLDWPKLILFSNNILDRTAKISAVVAPNQLLLSSPGKLDIGARVNVKGVSGSADGYAVEELASDMGSQYRIALDSHWRNVTDSGNSPCIITILEQVSCPPRGYAIEGSTEATLRVNPAQNLKIGETLEMRDDQGSLLYQVSGLKLEEEAWDGSLAIVARARLIQVGALDSEGMIVSRPSLPAPYQAIYRAKNEESALNEDFMRIGTLKGTGIPVGIRKGWRSEHGHLAILGMSGMGKTTTAAKLANVATEEDKFVIMDETSEYRTRLGFIPTPMSELDWNKGGIAVCEPGGEMPAQCERLIREAMVAAEEEYRAGKEPRRRFILLEEAHGWLPEWNFTNPTQSAFVNKSCRFILQARKFNISFVMVSQRTAVISKSALSQCENYIILRTLDQTSLEYIESVVGAEIKGVVSELGKYEAVCVGPIFNSDTPIVVALDPAVLIEKM